MMTEFRIEDREDATALFGPEDRHLRMLRRAFDVRISSRSGCLRISGQAAPVAAATAVLETMRRLLKADGRLSEHQVSGLVSQERSGATAPRGMDVGPKSEGQGAYLDTIRRHDITFCVGPAGTGKTFLAVAMALEGLRAGSCRRIVLARPAVEAGEKLGFLPGDLQEKVNPYLRPLFDALGILIDDAEARRLIARGVVEVVPLAFMRGRTLDRSFVILDEAQNCTVRQMRMFLTRLGAEARAGVTGDATQTDLPPGEVSGLNHAWKILQGIRGIGFVSLGDADVVRHPLVRKIVQAYERDAAPGA